MQRVYKHLFVGIQMELYYGLKVHAAASPPGFPLGRTRRAWNFGNARRGSPTVESFIVFQTNKMRSILLLRKLKKNLRTKSLVGSQNSKGV